MSRDCKSWATKEAEEEWLSQELLFINTSVGLIMGNISNHLDVKENGTRPLLAGFPADGGTKTRKAGLRLRGGSLMG